jgi:hypothetical protein
VMLTINGHTIIPIILRLEATIQQYENMAPLCKYYCKRFLWSEDSCSSIDWDCFWRWPTRIFPGLVHSSTS